MGHLFGVTCVGPRVGKAQWSPNLIEHQNPLGRSFFLKIHGDYWAPSYESYEFLI